MISAARREWQKASSFISIPALIEMRHQPAGRPQPPASALRRAAIPSGPHPRGVAPARSVGWTGACGRELPAARVANR